MMDEALVEVAPAARELNRSSAWVRQQFDRGTLAGVRTVSGQRLIYRSAVEEFLRERARRSEASK